LFSPVLPQIGKFATFVAFETIAAIVENLRNLPIATIVANQQIANLPICSKTGLNNIKKYPKSTIAAKDSGNTLLPTHTPVILAFFDQPENCTPN
jgi:ribosome-binding ATPase YchF (GTP1/OBG family)